MTMTAILDQFPAGAGRLPGGRSLDELRRASLARFGELGLPTRRIETWHYTDLSSLADKPLDYLGTAPDDAILTQAGAALEGLGLDDSAPRCVFVDGHLITALSRLAADDGILIESLADAPGRLLASGGDSALEALNTAFASAGAAIRVAGQPAGPVQLVFIGSGRGLALQQRLGVTLEPGARATLIEHFVDLGGAGEAWLNLVTDIDQGESSELTVCRLQQHGPEQIHTSLTRAALAERASLTAAGIELGGRLVRNELKIALNGREAKLMVRGLAVTRDRQHCDTRIAVDHRAADTRSRQDYRAIAADASRSVFNGKVTVREDAQHIEARQRNDNLLLSAKAEIDTKPELEIYADQVVCSHGATVGELSEDELFYLRSRGIDAESARGILTTAFADVILDGIELDAFRDLARKAATACLPRRVELE